MTARRVGLAHLTLLALTAPELVRIAARAGYDFVGLRVLAATPGEDSDDLRPGSALSRETLRALEETGLSVMDIEFLPIGADTKREHWMAAFESGAQFHAQTLSVTAIDSDLSRLTDTLTQIADDGRAYGITPTLEPISYNTVSTVTQAAEVAKAADAAVLLDALHIQRGGSTIEQVRELSAALVPMLQLCDARLTIPTEASLDAPMPRGMTTNGSPLQLEARALRLPLSTGELPLGELLAAVAADTPVSVEIPNAMMQATMNPLEWAKLHRSAVARLLDSPHEAAR